MKPIFTVIKYGIESKGIVLTGHDSKPLMYNTAKEAKDAMVKGDKMLIIEMRGYRK